MRSQKELQELFKLELKRHNEVLEEHFKRKEEYIKEFLAYAKYREGDQIEFLDRSWGKSDKKEGIIRKVKVIIESNSLFIAYDVGKVTKSGKIHKSHNITYRPIHEDWIL